MSRKYILLLLSFTLVMAAMPLRTAAETYSADESVVYEEDEPFSGDDLLPEEDPSGEYAEEDPDIFFADTGEESADDEFIAEESVSGYGSAGEIFEESVTDDPALYDSVIYDPVPADGLFPEEAAELPPDPYASAASEEPEEAYYIEGLEDSDILFEAYVHRLFYGEDAPPSDSPQDSGMQGNGYAALDEESRIVYGYLYDAVSKIAAGERSSTEVGIPLSAFGYGTQDRFTAEDLGVDALLAEDEFGMYCITEEAHNAMYGKLSFHLDRVIDQLLLTLPYELYWYDKTQSAAVRYTPIEGNSLSLYFADEDAVTISLPVNLDYSEQILVDGSFIEPVPYVVNTDMTGAAAAAAENAKAVIRRCGELEDLDKLEAYRDYILQEISYNNYAASSDTVPYGNPWQMIWVFDEDPLTDVVCEGYAKAFKYLCDYSAFTDSRLACFLASGHMSGGTGAGDHMWNLVRMEDTVYLADITNSDTGTVGEDGSLFLAGADDYLDHGFVANGVVYSYDNETLLQYEEEFLTISGVGYYAAHYEVKPVEAAEIEVSFLQTDPGREPVLQGQNVYAQVTLAGAAGSRPKRITLTYVMKAQDADGDAARLELSGLFDRYEGTVLTGHAPAGEGSSGLYEPDHISIVDVYGRDYRFNAADYGIAGGIRIWSEAEAIAAEREKAAALAREQAADAVMALIAALPDNAGLADEAAVQSASAAFNALTAEEKALVRAQMLAKLARAETLVADAKAAAEKAAAAKAAAEKAAAAKAAAQKAAAEKAAAAKAAAEKAAAEKAAAEKAEAEKAAAEEAARISAMKAAFHLNFRPGDEVAVQLKKNVKKIFAYPGEGDAVRSVVSDNPGYVKASFSGRTICLKGLKNKKKATITVMTEAGASVSFTVRVQKAKVRTKKITAPKKVTVKAGTSLNLGVVVSPVTTLDKLKFKISDRKIASVSKNGVVTAKKAGIVKITVTSGKKRKTVTVTVKGKL